MTLPGLQEAEDTPQPRGSGQQGHQSYSRFCQVSVWPHPWGRGLMCELQNGLVKDRDTVPAQRAGPGSPPCGQRNTCPGLGRWLPLRLQARAGREGRAAVFASNLILRNAAGPDAPPTRSPCLSSGRPRGPTTRVSAIPALSNPRSLRSRECPG